MSINLDPRYQEEAYDKIKDSLKQTKKAGIIMPTGTGKTYLALKLIEDSLASNKQILYVSPSPKINAQVRKIIRANYSQEEARRILSKVKFVTYHGLQNRFKNHKEDMVEYNSDTIILDEVHRSGAHEWGKAVNYLLENNKEANILGMTATPLRNDGQDMIDIRCGGVTYELKISEAVARGILKLPIYINARHISDEDVISLEEKIELIEDEKERKKLEERLKTIKKQAENAQNLSEVYEKHLKSDGKYFVFNNPGDDLEKLQEQAKKQGTFDKVNKNQKYYIVESSRGEVENQAALDGFERKEKGVLKLLYVKNMLSEGYHHEDLAGEIMVRPTKSYILFVQQLGRILSKERKEMPVVLDLVGNIRYFKEFRLEVQEIIRSGIARGETVYDEKVLESFRILEEQEEFVKAFEQIEDSINSYLRNNTLRNLLKIENWCENNFGDKEKWDKRLPSKLGKTIEEKKLGSAYKYVKKCLKKYEGKKLEEIENEEDKGLVIRLRKTERKYGYGTHQKYYLLGQLLKIEDWCKRNFGDKPKWERRLPSYRKGEKPLSDKIIRLKRVMKHYEGKNIDEIENEEDREVVLKLRDLEKEYAFGQGQTYFLIGQALKVEDWCKKKFEDKPKWERRLPTIESNNEEEKKLGTCLVVLNRTMKQYEQKRIDEIENEEDREVVLELRELDKKYGYGMHQKYYLLGQLLKIEDWCKRNFEDKPKWERRLPTSESNNEEEKKLGSRLYVLKRAMKHYEEKNINEIENEEDRKIVIQIRELEEEYAFGNYQKYYQYGQMLRVEDWCEKNNEGKEERKKKLPNPHARDKEENSLGRFLYKVRKRFKGIKLEDVKNEGDRKVFQVLKRLDETYNHQKKQELKKAKEERDTAKDNNNHAKELEEQVEEQLRKRGKPIENE